MPSPDAPTRYAIGVYELDTLQRIVERDGVRVGLTPKAVDLLTVLATRAGEVVSKTELMDAVWPDAVVDESALSKLVFTLRKELDELGIETIPKRGYRLVAEVRPRSRHPERSRATWEEGGAPSAHPGPSTTLGMTSNFIVIAAILVLIVSTAMWLHRRQTVKTNTLMVAPFTGGDPALAQSVGEFITSRLAGLNVTTTRSGAQLVLNGVVERSGEQVRLSWRITAIDDGQQISAASASANASEVADLEGRAAEAIAALIRLRQGVERYHDPVLTTPARQQTYLRAIALISPEVAVTHNDEAITLLQSIAPDANRSPYVLTALGRVSLYRRGLERAQSYLEQAAKLSPNHPRVLALRGLVHRFRGEFAQGEADMRASLAAEPDTKDVLLDLARVQGALSKTAETVKTYNYLIQIHPECAVCFNSYGVFEMYCGRLQHAEELFRRSVALEPGFPGHRVNLAAVQLTLGRIDEAIPLLEQAISTAPSAYALAVLASCQLLRNEPQEAWRNLSEAARLEPNSYALWSTLGDTLLVLRRDGEARAAFDRCVGLTRATLEVDPNEPLPRAILAECLAKRGDVAAATKEIDVALADVDPVPDLYLCAAVVRMHAGDVNAAIELLRRANDKGVSPVVIVRDPRFAPLRSTPQFMMWNEHALPMSPLPH